VGKLKQLPARIGGLGARVKSLPKRAESFYTSVEWKAYRKAHRAWTRAKQGGVWCRVCGAVGRLILDHEIERKDGGDDFPPYDQAHWYCTGCHNRKTAEARKARALGKR